jgi:hypothetical protein
MDKAVWEVYWSAGGPKAPTRVYASSAEGAKRTAVYAESVTGARRRGLKLQPLHAVRLWSVGYGAQPELPGLAEGAPALPWNAAGWRIEPAREGGAP